MGHGIFFICQCKQLFVSELIMLISPDSGYVLHNSLLHLLLKNGDFLNTDISQGSVATRLGFGGIFIYNFVTHFLLSLTVKEF